jgi:uncharacterized protein YecT (DUF1311 family)
MGRGAALGLGLGLAAMTGALWPTAGLAAAGGGATRRGEAAELGVDQAHMQAQDRYLSPAFKACAAATEGQTAAIRDCSAAEYERQDRLLNEAYRERMAALPAPRQAELRRAERDWLKRRERYCNSVSNTGGTIDLIETDDCFLSSTIQRVLFVRSFR